eukprot:813270-Pyramimonas_sp.AAC.1
MIRSRESAENDSIPAPILANGWVLNRALEEPKKHEKTLRKIFQHPMSTNVSWKEVEKMLNKGLGATLEPALVHRTGGSHKGVPPAHNGVR